MKSIAKFAFADLLKFSQAKVLSTIHLFFSGTEPISLLGGVVQSLLGILFFC